MRRVWLSDPTAPFSNLKMAMVARFTLFSAFTCMPRSKVTTEKIPNPCHPNAQSESISKSTLLHHCAC